MAKKIDISDGDILAVVTLLKMIFGTNRDFKRLLEKVDTPQEITKIRSSVQELVDLVASI